jgi:D-alanine transaminase
MIVYFNGEYTDKEAVSISPDDRGYLLSDGIYDVIVSYDGSFFMPKEHMARLQNGMDVIRLKMDPGENLIHIGDRLIRDNGLERQKAVYYLQITRGVAPRRHAFPPPETRPTVYGAAWGFTPLYSPEKGIRVVLEKDIRWGRCDIKTIGLLPNVLAAQSAKDRGADECLLTRDGVVTEGTHAAFCAVFDGRLVTHPLNERILPSVTRQAILSICSELGIAVDETPVSVDNLKDADEMMLLGSTVEVMPVVRLESRPVGGGKPGPITIKLQAAYRRLTRPGAPS